MCRYSFNNKIVAVNYKKERKKVYEETIYDYIRPGDPVFTEIIGTTCSQITLRNIAEITLFLYMYT
jgi:hypothetical protein